MSHRIYRASNQTSESSTNPFFKEGPATRPPCRHARQDVARSCIYGKFNETLTHLWRLATLPEASVRVCAYRNIYMFLSSEMCVYVLFWVWVISYLRLLCLSLSLPLYLSLSYCLCYCIYVIFFTYMRLYIGVCVCVCVCLTEQCCLYCVSSPFCL